LHAEELLFLPIPMLDIFPGRKTDAVKENDWFISGQIIYKNIHQGLCVPNIYSINPSSFLKSIFIVI